jgi:zinc protease
MRNRTLFLSAFAVFAAVANADAQAPKKVTPPAPLPLGPVNFPAFVERSLGNGAKVVVVENHEQPVVSVNIYIKGAGAVSDSDAKPGVASMTATLLDAGTATRTSKQIAETVEGMGANLNTDASSEWANVSATMLKSDVDQVLGVVADILTNASFPADEVETERKRSLTDLQVALSRPATMADRQFQSVVFGKHPYGRLSTTTSLRSITREDLVAFHKTYYKPGNALIVVAGDVDPADITTRLEKHLANWTGSAPARPQFAPVADRAQREIILVNKPGAVQAAFRVGHTIVPATNPDWPALTVALHILGGSSEGWLESNLRGKKGYTYAARSIAQQRIDPGSVQLLWSDVRNAAADSALELFVSLAQKLKDQPIPAADLEIAKSYLTGSFPLTIETPSQIASQVAAARLLGRPADHVQTWRQKLAAVTPADVQRVAKTYLHPENAVIVVSGDANALKPKLEKFGKVTVVDEEGKPLAAADVGPAQAKPIGIDASSLQPSTLVYNVIANGQQVAEITRTVARETAGGKDVIKASSNATGMMTMTSELKFDAKTFAPISASLTQARGGQEMRAMMSVSGGKVSGMVTPPQGDPQMIDAAFPEGTLLPGMDEFVMWLTNFDTTKELKLNSFNMRSSSVVPVTVKLLGESKQKVAAGEFDVYELEVKGAEGGVKLYMRKAAPHILVKQELLTQPVVIELKAIK